MPTNTETEEAAADTSEDQVTLTLVRQLLSPSAPPLPVNHFNITRINDEFLIEPGFFDFVELKNALDQWHQTHSRVEVPIKVPVRLTLQKTVLLQLYAAISQILEAERKEGA